MPDDTPATGPAQPSQPDPASTSEPSAAEPSGPEETASSPHGTVKRVRSAKYEAMRRERKREKRRAFAVQGGIAGLVIALIATFAILNHSKSTGDQPEGAGVDPADVAPAIPVERTSAVDREQTRLYRLRRAKELEADAWRDIHAGRFEPALETLGRAIEVSPDIASLHFTRGKALHDLGRYDEALAELHSAVEADPSSTACFVGLGSCYVQLGDLAAAEVCLEAAVAIDPDLPRSLEQLARIWRRGGLVEKASAAASRAVSLAPADGRVLATHALLLLDGGEIDQAETFARDAIGSDPAIADGYRVLAAVHAIHGNVRDAVDTLADAYDQLGASTVAPWLRDPVFEPLRQDAQFSDLAGQVAMETLNAVSSVGTAEEKSGLVGLREAATGPRLELGPKAEPETRGPLELTTP